MAHVLLEAFLFFKEENLLTADSLCHQFFKRMSFIIGKNYMQELLTGK